MSPDAQRPPGTNLEAATESIGRGRQTEDTSGPDLLDRLDGIRRCRGGWIAFCPSHFDQVGVLTISATAPPFRLVCQAGCALVAVYAAVGMVEP